MTFNVVMAIVDVNGGFYTRISIRITPNRYHFGVFITIFFGEKSFYA